MLSGRERRRRSIFIEICCDVRREMASSAPRGSSFDGAVLSDRSFVLRWSSTDTVFVSSGNVDDRLLVVNLGAELFLTTLPEPLLAPPTPAGWRIFWSSEDSAYGGAGTAPLETADGWRIPGQSAVLLASSAV